MLQNARGLSGSGTKTCGQLDGPRPTSRAPRVCPGRPGSASSLRSAPQSWRLVCTRAGAALRTAPSAAYRTAGTPRRDAPTSRKAAAPSAHGSSRRLCYVLPRGPWGALPHWPTALGRSSGHGATFRASSATASLATSSLQGRSVPAPLAHMAKRREAIFRACRVLLD